MTLNGHFALTSVFLKPVVKVVSETEKNSCGIARFPCDNAAFLFAERESCTRWRRNALYASFILYVVRVYVTCVVLFC